MGFDWLYLCLNSEGRLAYKDGADANENWPNFDSMEEAQEFLENKDIRADCVGRYVEKEAIGTPDNGGNQQ